MEKDYTKIKKKKGLCPVFLSLESHGDGANEIFKENAAPRWATRLISQFNCILKPHKGTMVENINEQDIVIVSYYFIPHEFECIISVWERIKQIWVSSLHLIMNENAEWNTMGIRR